MIPFFSLPKSDIWFSPNKTEMLNSHQLDKKWRSSRRSISIFKFYSEVIEVSSVESLRDKFNFLKENNIKVAIELPGLTWRDNSTGYKIEGFRQKGFSRSIIKKILMAGGVVDYIALDEPITFGAYKSGPNYPHLSPENLARELYANLSPFYQAFPNVNVGDIEALSEIPGYFYSNYIPQFLNSYKLFSGRRIAFFHLDQYWRGNWKTPTLYINHLSKLYGFRVGVIFNASVNTKSDSIWMDDARKNVMDYYNFMHRLPNDVIVQSWNYNPTNPIGDNDKNANSSLVIFISKMFSAE